MNNAPHGAGWWQATDGNWYPPEQHPESDSSSVSSGYVGEGLLHKSGDTYYADPSGRFALRAAKGGGWTSWVLEGPDAKPKSDPEGAQVLRNTPAPNADDGWLDQATVNDLTPHPGCVQWEYRVVSATFGQDLERNLNTYGRAGWEVISLSAANGTVTLTGNKIFALLKRPRQQPI